MLHTKFQGHQPFGSGEEDFLKLFTIYGHGGHLGQDRFNKRSFKLHMKFDIGPVVSEEKMFKECGWQTDDRQTDNGGLPIL